MLQLVGQILHCDQCNLFGRINYDQFINVQQNTPALLRRHGARVAAESMMRLEAGFCSTELEHLWVFLEKDSQQLQISAEVAELFMAGQTSDVNASEIWGGLPAPGKPRDLTGLCPCRHAIEEDGIAPGFSALKLKGWQIPAP